MNDAAVADDHAFASSNHGFHIFDITDPWNPYLLGEIAIPAGGGPFAIHGWLAYLIAGSELLVIDHRLLSSPTIIGRVPLPPFPNKIAASSTRVCVLTGQSMVVIDVSEPTTPRIASDTYVYGGPHGIAVIGDIAYVSAFGGINDDEDALYVWDLSSADAPRNVGAIRFEQALHDLAVDEATGFLFASGSKTSYNGCGGEIASSLHRLNVSIPEEPRLSGQQSLQNEPGLEIAVGGGFVAALTQIQDSEVFYRVTLFDQTTFPSSPLARMTAGRMLAVDRDVLIVNHASARLITIGDQRSQVPAIARGGTLNGGEIGFEDGLVVAAIAHVTDYRYGGQTIQSWLNSYDNSQPSLLRPVGEFRVDDEVSTGVAFAGGKGYFLTTQKLRVIQIDAQSSPIMLGILDLGGQAIDVDPTRRLVLVGKESTLRVVDVGDASAPFVRSSLDLPGVVKEVVISGSLAYIPNDDRGLQIVDIADPDHPHIVSGIDTPGTATDVVVGGDRAVMTSGDSLQVIDVAAPTNPTLISSLKLPARALRLDRHGSIVYVTCGWDGLAIINLSDDTQPTLMTLSPTRGKAFYDVVVSSDGERIYISGSESECFCSFYPCDANTTSGDLQVFPAQCPPGVSPVEITQLEAFAHESDIVIRWRSAQPDEWSDFRLHRSESEDGNYAEQPLTCTRFGDDGYEFRDNTVRKGVTYSYRLEARDRSGQSTFYGPVSGVAGQLAPMFLGHSRPNPISRDQPATIQFGLPSAGSIRLRILDVNGRTVRDLMDGHVEKGDHVAIWDGCDAEGRALPAGIYYWELSGLGESFSRSVVKLR